jgi:hypothetical protein
MEESPLLALTDVPANFNQLPFQRLLSHNTSYERDGARRQKHVLRLEGLEIIGFTFGESNLERHTPSVHCGPEDTQLSTFDRCQENVAILQMAPHQPH